MGRTEVGTRVDWNYGRKRREDGLETVVRLSVKGR
jgi:hypothetical protein